MSAYYDEELPAGFQDADLEMSALEAAGNRAWRLSRSSGRARAAGDLAEAARLCTHGAGYGLDGLAARDSGDPGYGSGGFRCTNCGSRLTDTPWDGGTVTVPCEIGV